MKCDNCLNARILISENGVHSVCCLSEKVAMDCIMEKKDQRVSKFIEADKKVIDPSNLGRFDMRMINRGKCMLCGKELTEGLFFCKECETKAGGEDKNG